MYCLKCGTEIPSGYEFCMKCGTKVDINQEENANSELVAGKTNKINKKTFIAIVVAALLVVVIIAVLFIGSGTEKNGYVANIPWGTDVKTVQQKVEKYYKCDAYRNEEKNILGVTVEDYDGMKGVEATIVFAFDNNEELENVVVMFDSITDGEKIERELLKKYSDLFGTPEETVISQVWTTPNSTITLTVWSEDFISLSFEE